MDNQDWNRIHVDSWGPTIDVSEWVVRVINQIAHGISEEGFSLDQELAEWAAAYIYQNWASLSLLNVPEFKSRLKEALKEKLIHMVADVSVQVYEDIRTEQDAEIFRIMQQANPHIAELLERITQEDD